MAKATPAKTLRQDFDKALMAAAANEGWRNWEVATTWIDSAFLALRGRHLSNEAFHANETAYMEIVGKLKKPTETMRHFSIALGCVTLALQREIRDFLGPSFMELCANSHLGQFFTPPEVCSLLAQLSGVDQRPKNGQPLQILEPAAGVGAMLLAKAQFLREEGVNLRDQAHFVAIDLDRAAAKACFIQLELAGLSALVIHGDALTQETFAQWPTTQALVNLTLDKPMPAIAAE